MQDSDSFVARSHILTGQYIAEVAEALLFSCRRKIYGMQTSSTKAYGLIDSAFRKIDSSLRLREKGSDRGKRHFILRNAIAPVLGFQAGNLRGLDEGKR